jgi:hypothetical protein
MLLLPSLASASDAIVGGSLRRRVIAGQKSSVPSDGQHPTHLQPDVTCQNLNLTGKPPPESQAQVHILTLLYNPQTRQRAAVTTL